MRIEFVKERETKGAVLYKEVDNKGNIIESMYDAHIGSIYIRKSSLFMKEGIPSKITVTVETPIE